MPAGMSVTILTPVVMIDTWPYYLLRKRNNDHQSRTSCCSYDKCQYTPTLHKFGNIAKVDTYSYKNSAEADIAQAMGEIITACNVGQAKPGNGTCMKSMSRTIYFARFHTHCYRKMHFSRRLNINFDKVNGA